MDQQKQTTNLATGFEFEPLPDGNVVIEFFGDDGMTINKQVVTAEVVRRIPFVAVLTEIALKQGPEVAKEIIKKLNQKMRKGSHEEAISETHPRIS